MNTSKLCCYCRRHKKIVENWSTLQRIRPNSLSDCDLLPTTASPYRIRKYAFRVCQNLYTVKSKSYSNNKEVKIYTQQIRYIDKLSPTIPEAHLVCPLYSNVTCTPPVVRKNSTSHCKIKIKIWREFRKMGTFLTKTTYTWNRTADSVR